MKTKFKTLILFGILSLLLVGCDNTTTNNNRDDNEVIENQEEEIVDKEDRVEDDDIKEDFNLEETSVVDLMSNVQRSNIESNENLNEENTKILTNFGLDVLKNSIGEDEENILISPVSIIYALGMTANGAQGETLRELEDTIGISIDELNGYLNAYLNYLPTGEDYKFILANSMWFREDSNFIPNEDFLQINKDYYNANVFEGPFNEQTVSLINKWVNTNTQGMIDSLVDELPQDSIMVLLNALSLDAKWDRPYTLEQIHEGEFTKEDGESQNVEFMYEDMYGYIEGESEVGFKKDYMDSKYSFVALLPDENIPIKDYVENLSGEEIHSLLNNIEDTEVETSIPKFSVEYSDSLSETLENLGITRGFSEVEAEFNKMGDIEENIFIGDVIHKTFIEVDEVGTKAGAVTGAIMETTSAPIEDKKEVHLDRPFVYMIIDNEYNHPIFIGTVNKIEK